MLLHIKVGGNDHVKPMMGVNIRDVEDLRPQRCWMSKTEETKVPTLSLARSIGGGKVPDAGWWIATRAGPEKGEHFFCGTGRDFTDAEPFFANAKYTQPRGWIHGGTGVKARKKPFRILLARKETRFWFTLERQGPWTFALAEKVNLTITMDVGMGLSWKSGVYV